MEFLEDESNKNTLVSENQWYEDTMKKEIS